MGKQTTPQLQSGVRERNGKIQIDFYYNGKRRRETLPIEATPKNLKFAAQLRAAILFDISKGVFDYEKYFPDSKQAKLISADLMMSELLKRQIELYKLRYSNGNMSISTLQGYINSIEAHLLPNLGNIELSKLTPLHIKDMIYRLNCSAKTIRNILIPLSKVLKTALNDGLISSNPMDKLDLDDVIKDVAQHSIREGIDPFNEEEKLHLISNCGGQFRHLVQFNFYAGLRTGELIALRWKDINFENKVIHIRRNIVRGEEKEPKTKSGIRQILMLSKAEEALKLQFELTGHLKDYVFHNPVHKMRWANDQAIRQQWRKLFNDGKVRYRYFYQTRHSYASMLLSNGENIAWIATQLGHINTEMVIKNYGKFIPDNQILGGYKLKGNY